MRITRTIIHIISITAVAGVLFACSNRNSDGNAPLVDNSGKHVANWVKQHAAAARVSMSACGECHGSDLSGGIAKVSCTSQNPISGFKCHVTSPLAAPSGCSSCHNAPPNGTTAPNRQFSHDTHLILPNVTCGACHTGLGYGTPNHADGIHIVSLSDTLKAKTVTTTYSYDSTTRTCASVSCHGGQTTPSWNTAHVPLVANNNAVCNKCHEQGAAQYNSYDSGNFQDVNMHQYHLTKINPATSALVYCTDCHNIGTLTNKQKHYGGVTNRTFTAPGATIGGIPTSMGVYDAAAQRCSGVMCHTLAPKDNVRWIQ